MEKISKQDTMKEYLDNPAIGSSFLAGIHYDGLHNTIENAIIEAENRVIEPSHLSLGSAIHRCIELYETPDLVDTEIITKPDLRTKVGKELYNDLEGSGKIMLDSTAMKSFKYIKKNILKNKLIPTFTKDFKQELSHYIEMNGVMVKVRPDLLHADRKVITSVKSTRNVQPEKYNRECDIYHYFFKERFYQRVLSKFYGFEFELGMIVIGNSAPYNITFNYMNQSDLNDQDSAIDSALEMYKDYLDKKIVPQTYQDIFANKSGNYKGLIEISLPSYGYAKPNFEDIF